MPPTEYAAGSGAPIADPQHTDAADASPTVSFQMLPTTSITTSLTNPRKTFDAFKLKELTESIRASGVHQPILVRPLPGTRTEDTLVDRGWGQPLPAYELICGERRLRACRMAGVEEIPAMIKPLTDAQVLECQIVENLQRDDLSPLEEAEGYERLVASTGIAKEDIGARIGRSRGYVYARLKLLDLCQEGRQALADGSIDASVGLLVARIPNTALQAKAVIEFTREQYDGDRLSVRGCKAWIDKHVMIKLAQAPFDGARADLVPAAGNCNQCSKRTGAARDLFSDYDAPDLCTDRACYDSKVAAHYLEAIDKARAKGMTVIDGDEAKRIRPSQWQMRGYELVDETTAFNRGGKTIRQLLTREERKHIALLVDPADGEPLEIIPEDIVAQVEDRLHKAEQASMPPADRAKAAKAEQEDLALHRANQMRELAERHALAWRQAALKDLLRAVLDERRAHAFTAAMLRVLLLHVTSYEMPNQAVAAGLGLGAEDEDDVDDMEWDDRKERIAAIPDVDLGPRLLALLMTHESVVVSEGFGRDRKLSEAVVMREVALACGIDLVQHQVEAREALRAEYDEIKALAGETAPREPASRDDLPVGATVRFKADLKGPNGQFRKVSGRDGAVIGHMGDRALMVRFGPATHEVASADWTELLVLDVPAAAPAAVAKPARKGKMTAAEASAAIARTMQAAEDAGAPMVHGKAKRAPATPLDALEQTTEAAA